MEIKGTIKSIEKVVTINLPYYSKNAVYVYKVISENETLKVGFVYPSIEVSAYLSDMPFAKDTKEITEEEFKEKYNEVLTKLNEKL